MKLLKKLAAFVLVFCITAGTVAAISAAVDTGAAGSLTEASPDEAADKLDAAPVGADSYTPRLTAPAYTNKYYYSDLNVFYKYGYGMPNCTCYAWGRAYELLNKKPDLCVYDAYLWYGYNKEHGYYPYGQTPKLGAIACWVYSSGVSGHVAVVEKIEDDTITFSNSAYAGTTFYTTTSPINDPSDGRSTWIFQGYIYVGDFGGPSVTVTDPVEDPVEGDIYRITSDTGVNVRSGAGTSYNVIGGLGYHSQAVVTETKKANGYTWGRTTIDGVTGWFVTDFAELIRKAEKPTETTPAEPATEAPALAPTEEPTEPAPVEMTLPPDSGSLPDGDYLIGDLDEDGRITIMDATRIQLILAELMAPTNYMLTVGDYDRDGLFTIMDASRIGYDLAYERI